MSRHVPVLVEVVTRGWGLDDPRVLPHLRAENQPGRGFRMKAVTRRAQAAGWPDTASIAVARKAASAAVRRLEGVDYIWNGNRHHDQFKVSAYESRRSGRATVSVDDYDDRAATIYDE